MSFCVFLLFLLLCAIPSESNRGCEEKEKSLALLELAKDSITKARELVPHCEGDVSQNKTQHKKTECGLKDKSEAYMDIALNLIEEAKEGYPNCNIINPKDEKKSLPADCLEVQRKGYTKSGVYTILLQSVDARNKTLDVFCDMDTDGGGWTVIQRRGNFTPLQDFYQGWNAYKNGFGNISTDFWIGNDNIFFLSNRSRTMIRFDMGDATGERAYAAYSNFSIESEVDKYRLHIEGYNGNAGDSMPYHNGNVFSTKDRTNSVNTHCPEEHRSGWWFYGCSWCNPNGVYQPGVAEAKSAHWEHWKKFTGLAFIEIKIKHY